MYLVLLVSCADQGGSLNPGNESGNQNPENTPIASPDSPPADRPTEGVPLEKLRTDVAFYRGRYQLPDIFRKLTNDRGNGFEDLYGTRNMREVLTGVYYRGGGNNRYHRTNPRANMNPLPADGLANLCQDGFALGIYFYETNYDTATKLNPCRLRTTGQTSNLYYDQITAFSLKDFKPFLQLIHDRIKGKISGPIYGHCWNGWHASGMMAAIALKQFCGFTDVQAEDYWVKNTDGNSEGYDSVRRKVRNFKALTGLEITSEEKSLICPR